jgi:hypothetical protein
MQIKAIEMVRGTECGIGYVINYQRNERFEVERAERNVYGAVIVYNFLGQARGLSENEDVEVLGHFNI